MTDLSLAEPGAETRPVHAVRAADLEAFCEARTEAERAWLREFEAKPGQLALLPGADGGPGAAAFGLGSGAGERRAFGALPFRLPPGDWRIEGEGIDGFRAALGWLLGSTRFDRFKAEAGRAPARLACPGGVDAERVLALARGAALARRLIDLPASHMGPRQLAAEAKALAEAHGAAFSVIEGDELLSANYPLIHAVGRAGPQPPRLIDIRHGEEGPRVTLVGKGVCFDTGGLDIKPSSAMLLMKKDMGGAACVLALAAMILARRLPVRLRVLIPAVENSVSATSFRPGDVLTARNGLTVENRNTDAEGRLVLADALVEACSEEPDLLIDLATLTGAARVALGPDLPPFYTDDEALAGEVSAAGEAMDDPLWRLPLWPGYEADIGSKVAEITNAPSGGMAGSITAALFLKRFVKGAGAWLHADIYGWAPKPQPGRPEGGECQAALALFKVIEDRYGDGDV